MKNTLSEAVLQLKCLDFRSLKWDRQDLEVVTHKGEGMVDSEFRFDTETRNFIESFEDECFLKDLPPFILRLTEEIND